MEESVAPYLELYEQTKALAGHNLEWLTQIRAQAKQQLQRQGLPNNTLEEWKHWPLKTFMRAPTTTYLTAPSSSVPRTDFFKDCYCLESCDGFVLTDSDDFQALQKIIQLTPFEHYLKTEPVAAKALLSTLREQEGFATLAALFASSGLVLTIPHGVQLDKPIVLRHFSTKKNSLTCPIYAIHLETKAQATLIHSYHSEDTNYCINLNTHIHCDANSRLEFYQIQAENSQARHINTTHAYLQADSHFYHFNASLGAKLSRHAVHCFLQDRGARCTLDSLFFAGMRQHCDQFTEVQHEHSQTYSQQNYKGLIDRHGQGVFNGKIIVQKGAEQCQAQQVNHNLLLDDSASIASRPQLEIFNDDVQCTHGATNGALDPDTIFYLRSRGVALNTAKALLSYGFAKNQLDTLANRQVSAYTQALLLQALPNNTALLEMIQ